MLTMLTPFHSARWRAHQGGTFHEKNINERGRGILFWGERVSGVMMRWTEQEKKKKI